MNDDNLCSNIEPVLALNDSCNNGQSCSHFDPTDKFPHTSVLRIVAWVNVGLAFISTLVGVIYIFSCWIKQKRKIKGWPWEKKVYGVKISRFKCMPRRLVAFGLMCKLVPSLTMDVLDIFTDTLYFNQITQRCGVLDNRLHTPIWVFHILFIFMISGMIKNLVVTHIAYRQLTKSLPAGDKDESDLVDRNAYMALTFFQGILAFVFQDAVAALIQFFYIDKFVTQVNMTAVFNGVIMLLFSVRVLYVFTLYIFKYHEKSDPLKVQILHVIMFLTKTFVCTFHATRTYVVVFSKFDNRLSNGKGLDECVTIVESGDLKQDPFHLKCLTNSDWTLLIMTGLAGVGVLICTIVLGLIGFEHFKIFNQSHYSGRVGNISGISGNAIGPQKPFEQPLEASFEHKLRDPTHRNRATEF